MSLNLTEIGLYPKIVIKSVARNKGGDNIWYLLCKGELDLQSCTNELLNLFLILKVLIYRHIPCRFMVSITTWRIILNRNIQIIIQNIYLRFWVRAILCCFLLFETTKISHMTTKKKRVLSMYKSLFGHYL